MLPSSNGGALGAIGVCSLNLLVGVSGKRFGVLPSDMVAVYGARVDGASTNALFCSPRVDGAAWPSVQLCGAEASTGLTAANCLGSSMAIEVDTTASDYRS